jgi:hypothetical protein
MNTHLLASSPSGHLVPIPGGHHAFVPYNLPREVGLDSRLVNLLDQASRAVGTLEGVGETLPNPDLLIEPFVRREAVLSSKIEGTQTLISDLFLYEASNTRRDPRGDAREVTFWPCMKESSYLRHCQFRPGSSMLCTLPHDGDSRR